MMARQRVSAGRARAGGRPPAGNLLPRGNQPQYRPSEDQPPQVRQNDGWRVLSYLLGGMLIYGGLGWLVGHWTGISVLFPLGMILGLGLAIAMIVFRFTRS